MNPGAVQNIGRVPELYRRILFTFGMLAVYRLGCAVPTPGIDPEEVRRFFEETGGGLFGLVNLFTGGAFERLSSPNHIDLRRPNSSPRTRRPYR